MYKQEFYLYGQKVAESTIASTWIGKQPIPPSSKLFFCQFCGTTYGKVLVHTKTGLVPFQSYRSCCADCFQQKEGELLRPDTLLAAADDNYFQSLPTDILLWEIGANQLRRSKNGTTT